MLHLKRQVVHRIPRFEFRSCGLRGRRTYGTSGHHILRRRHSGCGLGLCGAFHFPSIDAGVPTTLVFPTIDVERYRQFFSRLNMRLRDAVFSKNLKTNLFRILVVRFEHIFLFLPRISGFTNSALFGQYCDYSSCYFHCVFIFSGAKLRLSRQESWVFADFFAPWPAFSG